MTNKILFIIGSTQPNDFHGYLAKSVGADFWVSNVNKYSRFGFVGKIFNTLKSIISLPRNYDIYLSETVYIIPALAKFLHIIPKKSLIINISADPVLYALTTKKKYSIVDKIHRQFIKYVDGFILIGKWGFLLNKLHITKPYFEIGAGISNPRYNQLLKIRINKKHKNHNIIFVGNISKYQPSSGRSEYKGFDILLGAFNDVYKKYPDSKLYIIGQCDFTFDNPNIIPVGYKKGHEFVEFLSKMALASYVARGDTFPMGSIETMLAGIPTFVSEFTGTKSIVENANKNFILPLSSQTLAKAIIDYFNLSYKEKVELSKKFRMAAKPYATKRIVKTFPNSFNILVTKIKRTKNKSNLMQYLTF